MKLNHRLSTYSFNFWRLKRIEERDANSKIIQAIVLHTQKTFSRFADWILERRGDHVERIKHIGLATKWLQVLSLPPNDKIRNHLVVNPKPEQTVEKHFQRDVCNKNRQ